MSEFKFNPQATSFDAKNALALGRASSLAYKDQQVVEETAAEWGFSKTKFISEKGTQAFVASQDEFVVVAFRGTQEIEDFVTDLVLDFEPWSAGRVHHGFLTALEVAWAEVEAAIDEMRDQSQTLWITGHSLGAALATLATSRLQIDQQKTVDGLYTFGSPRVGDKVFAAAYDEVCKEKSFRYRNNDDVVTRIPLPGYFLPYRHIGSVKYFDVNGRLRPHISWWRQLIDRIRGHVRDIGKKGLKGVKDHNIDGYVKLLENNMDVR